jgi:alpha/beta superfamily hydrolase
MHCPSLFQWVGRYGRIVEQRVCHPLGVTDGRFELAVPEGANLGFVLLHPHPDYGGDRFNPVVQALYDAVLAAGWAAIRFDFSSSSPSSALAEATDAMDRLPPGLPVVVAGYSFGAGIATQLIDERIVRWVLVAPPFGSLGLDTGAIASDPRPKAVLSPAHDQFCPPDAARAATRGWTATTVEIAEGADHFLAGATARVAAWAVELVRGDA